MGHTTGDEDRIPEKMVRIPGFVIRRYRPGDWDEARRIFGGGIIGLARPAFRMSVLAPLNFGLLLAASGAVHALTASASCTAAAFLGLLSLVYLGIRSPFTVYVSQALEGDMADIEGHYLSAPGCCFWVAEEEEVVEVEEEEGGESDWGQREGEGAPGGHRGSQGGAPDLPTACHLYRLSVDPRCRRRGLARALTQVVLDFARDGGFRLCALATTNVQQPALHLYRSMGFRLVRTEPLPLGFLLPLSPFNVCYLERRLEVAPPSRLTPGRPPWPLTNARLMAGTQILKRSWNQLPKQPLQFVHQEEGVPKSGNIISEQL